MRKIILFIIISIILLMLPLITAAKDNDKERPAPSAPRAVAPRPLRPLFRSS